MDSRSSENIKIKHEIYDEKYTERRNIKTKKRRDDKKENKLYKKKYINTTEKNIQC